MADETSPLIVLAEEKPVYLFEGALGACPGEKDCPIKGQFSLPAGRCVVRILNPLSADLGGGFEGTMFAYAQSEEFVVRSCAECRFNPVARAVIEQLRNPRPAETVEYEIKKKGMRAAFGMGSLGALFKDYIGPGIREQLEKNLEAYAKTIGSLMAGEPPGRHSAIAVNDDLMDAPSTKIRNFMEKIGAAQARAIIDPLKEYNRLVSEMTARVDPGPIIPPDAMFHIRPKEDNDDNDEE